MDNNKEHSKILVELGKQGEILKSIDTHLLTLNGKVASQENRIGKLEKNEAYQDGKRSGAKTVIVAFWAVVSAFGGAVVTTFVSHIYK